MLGIKKRAMAENKRKRVLMVQVNRVEAEFLRHLLEKVGGFDVVEVADGVGLIRRAGIAPSLILLDTQMPGDFLRALELLRRIPKLKSVPMAVVTGDVDKLPLCGAKGLNGYILKPFTPQAPLPKIWKLTNPELIAKGMDSGGRPQRPELDIDSIEDLPTLPSVYAEVERLCQNPDVDAVELNEVIQSDPSITLKLLRLANSAFFGFSRKVTSVKDAVSLLGNQTVKNAVLSISIFEAAKDQKTTAGLDRKGFWQHSAGVGSIVRFLAGKLQIEREEGFTAGILHDIGKIILDGLFPEYYAPVLKAVAQKNILILQAEEEELGLLHTLVGQELAEAWQIPDSLVQGIAHHHSPEASQIDPELASLVHIGDVLCRNAGVGSGGDDLVPVLNEHATQRLGISPDQIADWEDEMLKEIEKDRAFL